MPKTNLPIPYLETNIRPTGLSHIGSAGRALRGRYFTFLGMQKLRPIIMKETQSARY
jgi:hypothetical protein